MQSAPAFVESTQVHLHPRRPAPAARSSSSTPATPFTHPSQLPSPSGAGASATATGSGPNTQRGLGTPAPPEAQQREPEQLQSQARARPQQGHTQAEQSGAHADAYAGQRGESPTTRTTGDPVRLLFRHPDPARARANEVLLAVHRGSETDTALVHTTAMSILRDIERDLEPVRATSGARARALPPASSAAGGRRAASGPGRPAAGSPARVRPVAQQHPEVKRLKSFARPPSAAEALLGEQKPHQSGLQEQQEGQERLAQHEAAHRRAAHPSRQRVNLHSCKKRSLALDPVTGPHAQLEVSQHGACKT